jgi:hypothetical protein
MKNIPKRNMGNKIWSWSISSSAAMFGLMAFAGGRLLEALLTPLARAGLGFYPFDPKIDLLKAASLL